jgi:hypothetical protein
MRRCAWAVVLLAAVVVGCGGGNRASVSGTVTLDGKPAEGATVSFTPESGAGGVGASYGKVDAAGRYTLETVIGDHRGAAVGRHRVSISLSQPNPQNPDRAATERIPTRYNVNSELTFDVPSGGSDKADFALTSK